jgi:hypothetical protein
VEEKMITMSDLTEDACDSIIIEFLQMHEEIAEEQQIREACTLLISYCGVEENEEKIV